MRRAALYTAYALETLGQAVMYALVLFTAAGVAR